MGLLLALQCEQGTSEIFPWKLLREHRVHLGLIYLGWKWRNSKLKKEILNLRFYYIQFI
jgi:hypothetical protein